MTVPRIRLSGFYFVYFAALGVLIPYWPLFLQAAGLDAARIGAVMAILPATKIISPSLWGWLADRRGQTLRLVRWASFLGWLTFSVLFIPGAGLAGVIIAMGLFSFCWNATLPLFETVTLACLDRQTHRYGGIRVWGSVGFILAVWGLGELLDGWMAMAELPWVMAGLLVSQWLLTLTLRRPPEVAHVPAAATSILGIVRRGEVIGFLMAAALLQMAHGPYYSFYSLYLAQSGYGDSTIGQLWALGVVAEIGWFLLLPRIARRVSLRALFLGSLALSAVRWPMMAFGVDHLSLLIAAQLLHAASFGAAHSAAIHIVHRNFRPPHHARGQALYSGLCYGLGGAVGSLYSGWLWESWQPAGVFLFATALSLAALLVAWPRVGKGASAGV